MNDLQALKGPLAILLLLASVLLVIAILISAGITEFIVPPPEQVAAGMVDALGARRYEGALNQMSEEVKNQVRIEDLRQLVDEIEARHQGIDQAEGVDSQVQGDSASATVQVRTQDGQEHILQFPLSSQNGIWSVDSIDPLSQLAASVQQ